jgi:hypothetical protein
LIKAHIFSEVYVGTSRRSARSRMLYTTVHLLKQEQ